MPTLQDFSGSELPAISSIASRVQHYQGLLTDGAVSRPEYGLLCTQAIDIELVKKLTDDEQLIQAAASAIEAIKSLASAFKIP